VKIAATEEIFGFLKVIMLVEKCQRIGKMVDDAQREQLAEHA